MKIAHPLFIGQRSRHVGARNALQGTLGEYWR